MNKQPQSLRELQTIRINKKLNIIGYALAAGLFLLGVLVGYLI